MDDHADMAALAKKLEVARRNIGLSYGSLGSLADVDTSQANRICRGKFKTLSENVLRICNVLSVAPTDVEFHTSAVDHDPLVATMQSELMKTWDRTPDGAKRLAELLRAFRNFSSM